jgi:hypothetical protein
MTDTERIDAMLDSRAWRQPLCKFGSRDEIDAAIQAGDPDKAASVYSGYGPQCKRCGKSPDGHDGLGRCVQRPSYSCRNALCQLTGEHTQGCLRQHETLQKIGLGL